MRRSFLATACVLGLAVGVTATPARQVRVAVLPIVVHSLEQQGYLREGLADMLAARLGQSPSVAVVRVDDPAQATTDAAAARAAARALQADYVLFGSFTRFGEGASLDVQCLPAHGDEAEAPRAIFIQSGSLGEIIPRLDGLAEKVVRYVNGGAAPSLDVAAPRDETGEALGDALSELESLRQRVERLEESVHGAEEVAADAETGPSLR